MPEYIDGVVEDDIIRSTKGLYKILGKSRNRGLTVYNVQKQLQLSGGNEEENNYDDIIKAFPESDRQGADEFLTYQDDIDSSMVERYGGSTIQQLFKKHKPKSRKMTAYDKIDIFNADNVQDFKSMSQAEEQFVKKYFKKDPQYIQNVRNVELSSQMKLGGCDCDTNGYEYALQQDDNMWGKFIEGGKMAFNVQKIKYDNLAENDMLEQMSAFKSVLKRKGKKGGDQSTEPVQPVVQEPVQPVVQEPVQPVVQEPVQPVVQGGMDIQSTSQIQPVQSAQVYESSEESSSSMSDESSSESDDNVVVRKIIYKQYEDDWM